MKILPLGAMTALVVSAAMPAAASPAFDGFRTVCGDSHMDFAAIKSAVDAGHWVPTEVTPNSMPGVTVTESVARTVNAGGAKLTLFAWHGTKGAVQVSACTVRVTQTKFAELSHDAQAWTGFAPQVSDTGKAVWQFTEDAGARKAVQKADYNTAAAAGGLNFFTVSSVGAETVIDLLKIKS